MLNDQIVIEYVNSHRNISWDKRDKNIVNYLLNRFNDFSVDNIYDKCRESVYRLKHNIEKCPQCENCGKPLKYLVGAKFYESGCSKKCKYILANKRLQKTSLLKYGTNRPSQSNKVKNKQKQTNLNKYNSISALQNENIKEKTKKTLLNKYGKDNIAKTEIWIKKVQETSFKKYNSLYPNQSNIVKEKIKQTTLKHYGVDNYFKSKECRKKVCSEKSIKKQIETKHKNHTFNTSVPEIKSYNLLKEKYPDILYQYKSTLYPFNCDFYIPSLDLYIECNYHWTHGGKPFEGTEKDKEVIKIWESKNTQYYKNAIKCWSIRDVNKRNIAKQNNLNYLEFFTILKLQEWLNN